MSAIWTGGRQDAFEFNGSDDIGGPIIGVNVRSTGIKRTETGCCNYGAHRNNGVFYLVTEVDGP